MSKSNFLHAKITGIAAVVPENVINIDDEIEFYKNDEKLLQRNKKILGLGKRHIVPDGVTNADLCEAAANRLITELSVEKNEIDALIVVSSSHDYIYPASACILQDRLGLSEDCACFDISGLACSAYVYGLWNAHSLIQSGAAKKCLLLVGDTVSRHSDKRNRNSNMLFGDAGVATLIEYTEHSIPSYFILGTRGSGWNKIVAPAGGSKLPIRKDIVDIEITDNRDNVWHLWDEIMKGMDIFKFTMEVAPKGIDDILKFSGKNKEEIDFFAFHQANKQIVDNIAKYVRLPKDQYSAETFTKYANCAAASIATNICDQLCGKNPENVLLSSFGVGLSWGFALLNMKDTKNLGISIRKTPDKLLTREELVENWISYFKGEIDELQL